LENFPTISSLYFSFFPQLDATFYKTRHPVNIALCFDKSHFRFTFATITTRVAWWSVASGRSIFRDKERPRRVLRWKKFTIPMFLLYTFPGSSHIRTRVRKCKEEVYISWEFYFLRRQISDHSFRKIHMFQFICQFYGSVSRRIFLFGKKRELSTFLLLRFT